MVLKFESSQFNDEIDIELDVYSSVKKVSLPHQEIDIFHYYSNKTNLL